MRRYEHHIQYMPGISEDSIDDVDDALIQDILRDRIRVYNRLGDEGWELVIEHQHIDNYSVVATFRRPLSDEATTARDAATKTEDQDPNQGAPAYPSLRPSASSPDGYRLVWER